MSERISVALYAPTASGGHARYVAELGGALSRHSELDVQVVTAEGFRGPPVRHARVVAVLPVMRPRQTYARTRNWLADRLRFAKRPETVFERWLGAQSVDLAHLQEWTWWYGPIFARRLSRLGKRVVMTVHNVHPHDRAARRLTGLPRLLALRLAGRYADAFIVHDDYNAELLRGVLRRQDESKVHVTLHGVWTLDHSAAVSGHLSNSEVSILCFGVVRENKGIADLLRAIPLLPKSVAIVIAGEATCDKIERDITAARAVFGAERVRRLIGFVENRQLDELFGGASVVALPYTNFSAQSGVLHLAIAYARPVVVTDVGGMPQLVQRFDLGRVVPPRSPAQLAAAISELLDPEVNACASRNAAAARDELTWEATARATAAVYATCMAYG